MGENSKGFEVNNPETGEVYDFRSGALITTIRQVLIDRRKFDVQGKMWKNLTEKEQRDEIESANALASDLLRNVVDQVSAAGLVCADVEVTKFGVDVEKGEVTITCKGYASDEMLANLAHAKGKTAKLTVIDVSQFTKGDKKPVADPDEPGLPIEGGDETPTPSGEVHVNTMEDDDDDLHPDLSPDELEPDEETEAEDDAGDPEVEDETDRDQEIAEAEAAPASDADTPEKEAAPVAASVSVYTEEELVKIGQDGTQAALERAGPDDNPYDGGTPEYLAWAEGLEDGTKQVNDVIQSGFDAHGAGKKMKENPWKDGNPAKALWTEGWKKANGSDKAKPEETESETTNEHEAEDVIANDAYAEGRQAAKDDVERDQNPHDSETAGTKHRFWNDGWDAINGA